MDFLRDPIWTFVGCCAGVFGVLLPFITTVLMNRRRLVCEVTNNSSIIAIAEAVKQRLQITIDGRNIENARLILLKFTNTGFLSIKESDYAEHIQVIFSSSSEVLEANIVSVNPKSLNPSIDFSKNEVSVAPIMLNRNDYFIVKILVNGDNPDISIKDRILGIKNISLIDGVNKTDNKYIRTRLSILAFFEWAMGAMFVLSFVSLTQVLWNPQPVWFRIISTVLTSGNLLLFSLIAIWFPYMMYKTFKK